MPYQDPEAARKQRDWHRRRGINRKVAANFEARRLPDWDNETLWTAAELKANAVWAIAAESADPALLSRASELWEVLQELKLRGTQLELPLSQ